MRIFRALIIAAAVAFPAFLVHAAPITAGSILLYRVGTGTGNLTNTGNEVFVDEYTTTGLLVQSIAMPTTTSGLQRQLIASGTASSEGLITVSPNGQYVTVTGYGRDLGGGTSLSGTTGATVNRTIGIINVSTGSVDTSTALSDFASGNNPRSAVTTNGTDIWMAGGAGGVRYTTLGNSTSTQLQTLANNRQVNVFDGQLYASNDSTGGGNTVILGSIGAGLPTTGNQTYTSLPGFIDHTGTASASAYAFFFADLTGSVAGVDTLYVADDSALALTKYSLVSGNWASNGTVGIDTNDFRGVTGLVNGSTVSLFATRNGGAGATGGGVLVSLVDSSGYNGAFTGTPTDLVTAGTNIAFRGVAAVPVPEPSTLAILSSLGAVGLAVYRHRRRSHSKERVERSIDSLATW